MLTHLSRNYLNLNLNPATLSFCLLPSSQLAQQCFGGKLLASNTIQMCLGNIREHNIYNLRRIFTVIKRKEILQSCNLIGLVTIQIIIPPWQYGVATRLMVIMHKGSTHLLLDQCPTTAQDGDCCTEANMTLIHCISTHHMCMYMSPRFNS